MKHRHPVSALRRSSQHASLKEENQRRRSSPRDTSVGREDGLRGRFVRRASSRLSLPPPPFSLPPPPSQRPLQRPDVFPCCPAASKLRLNLQAVQRQYWSYLLDQFDQTHQLVHPCVLSPRIDPISIPPVRTVSVARRDEGRVRRDQVDARLQDLSSQRTSAREADVKAREDAATASGTFQVRSGEEELRKRMVEVGYEDIGISELAFLFAKKTNKADLP